MHSWEYFAQIRAQLLHRIALKSAPTLQSCTTLAPMHWLSAGSDYSLHCTGHQSVTAAHPVQLLFHTPPCSSSSISSMITLSYVASSSPMTMLLPVVFTPTTLTTLSLFFRSNSKAILIKKISFCMWWPLHMVHFKVKVTNDNTLHLAHLQKWKWLKHIKVMTLPIPGTWRVWKNAAVEVSPLLPPRESQQWWSGGWYLFVIVILSDGVLSDRMLSDRMLSVGILSDGVLSNGMLSS